MKTGKCIKLLAIAILSPGLFFGTTAYGQDGPRLTLDIDTYPYLAEIKNDTDTTFVANIRITDRWSYFSFTNFRQIFSGGSAQFLFSEQNLRWKITANSPLDLALQTAIARGENNDRWRLGMRWRVSDTAALKTFFKRLSLLYTTTVFVKTFDPHGDDVFQLEHFFIMRFPKLTKRLYVSGWLDQTFGQNTAGLPRNHVLTEIQIGFRVIDNFHFVTEYRYFETRRGNKDNLGVGLEYKIRW